METLLCNVKKCAQQNNFYGSTGSSVHFWAQQVLGAMKAQPPSKSLVEKFPNYLLRVHK